MSRHEDVIKGSVGEWRVVWAFKSTYGSCGSRWRRRTRRRTRAAVEELETTSSRAQHPALCTHRAPHALTRTRAHATARRHLCDDSQRRRCISLLPRRRGAVGRGRWGRHSDLPQQQMPRRRRSRVFLPPTLLLLPLFVSRCCCPIQKAGDLRLPLLTPSAFQPKSGAMW